MARSSASVKPVSTWRWWFSFVRFKPSNAMRCFQMSQMSPEQHRDLMNLETADWGRTKSLNCWLQCDFKNHHKWMDSFCSLGLLSILHVARCSLRVTLHRVKCSGWQERPFCFCVHQDYWNCSPKKNAAVQPGTTHHSAYRCIESSHKPVWTDIRSTIGNIEVMNEPLHVFKSSPGAQETPGLKSTLTGGRLKQTNCLCSFRVSCWRKAMDLMYFRLLEMLY